MFPGKKTSLAQRTLAPSYVGGGRTAGPRSRAGNRSVKRVRVHILIEHERSRTHRDRAICGELEDTLRPGHVMSDRPGRDYCLTCETLKRTGLAK